MTIKLKTAHEIKFSPQGDRVAYFGGRNVTVLEFPSGNPVFDVHHTAHPSSIDFSPDGSRLVVKSTSGRTKVLDGSTGDVITDFRNQKEGEGAAAFFSRCGRHVVSVSWSGSLTVREVVSGDLEYIREYPEQKLGDLATTSDRSIFLYSVCRPPLSARNQEAIEKQSWPFVGDGIRLTQEWPSISSLHLSPSGRYLGVVSGSDVFEIYESKMMVLLRKQPFTYGGSGFSVAWSDDETLISYCEKDNVRVLSFPEMQLLHEFPLRYPCFVGFSAAATHIALGSWSTSYIVAMQELASFAAQQKKKWKPKK